MLENHQAICNGLREALKRTMQSTCWTSFTYGSLKTAAMYWRYLLEGVNASIQRVTAAGA